MRVWQKKRRLPRRLLRLPDGEYLVRFHALEPLTLAAGPEDFDLVDDRSRANSEMNAVQAGRCVADGARHIVALIANTDARADAVPIALGTHEIQTDPVTGRCALVMPKFSGTF